MIKVNCLFVLVALAALAGCTSTGSSPMLTSAYLTTANCYSYDYSRTGGGWCSGHMWH
jgi:hypothetical protein